MHSESDSALTSPIMSLTAYWVWVFISHIHACLNLIKGMDDTPLTCNMDDLLGSGARP